MKFYRKLENSVFGGVLSGLSQELNFDLFLLRLIALFLFFISAGLIGIIYLVLWIVLPAVDSKTTIKEELLDKFEKLNNVSDNKKKLLFLGGGLIIVGLLLLFNFLLPLDMIIKIVIPVILVIIGIYFIVKSR